jgi:hypothetical protein
MALPKLVTPEFETEIPSTKEPIKFSPFLVKEEKSSLHGTREWRRERCL